jgi:hypothetical protein
MENLARAALAALLCIGFAGKATGAEPSAPDVPALTGLEFFDQTFGPAASSCELGIVASGSPLVILRTSRWAEAGGLASSDRVIAVDGRPVPDHAALRSALGSRESAKQVNITVFRDDEVISVPVRCRDATPVLDAREEALDSASESRWNDCVRATYVEEMHWGGSNSQSAGLRLWCHRASRRATIGEDTAPLNPTHARLLYEYVTNLILESRNVAGVSDEFRTRLYHAAWRIADSGHTEIASDLSDLLASR